MTRRHIDVNRFLDITYLSFMRYHYFHLSFVTGRLGPSSCYGNHYCHFIFYALQILFFHVKQMFEFIASRIQRRKLKYPHKYLRVLIFYYFYYLLMIHMITCDCFKCFTYLLLIKYRFKYYFL